MSANVLLVDDNNFNLGLLQEKLKTAYYRTIIGHSGEEAISQTIKYLPDLIVVDLMMYEINGMDAAKILRSNDDTKDIPILVLSAAENVFKVLNFTALGLTIGGDDFLDKPVHSGTLLARVRALVKMKRMRDELKLREKSALEHGFVTKGIFENIDDIEGMNVLLIYDDVGYGRTIQELLMSYNLKVGYVQSGSEGLNFSAYDDVSLVIVGIDPMDIEEKDSQKSSTLIENIEMYQKEKSVSVLAILDAEVTPDNIVKVLDTGIDDYFKTNSFTGEMVTRVRTHLRNKKFHDLLQKTYDINVSSAMTDHLTGVFNRRYLNSHASNLLAKASLQSTQPLCVMMLDIDYFKEVNDNYGHVVGDKILKEIADRIKDSVRANDVCARYGGEEFVVMMSDSPLDVGTAVAERIRDTIANSPVFVGRNKEEVYVTCSIGVIVTSKDSKLGTGAEVVDALFEEVDRVMYKAKRAGRNKVVTG